MERKLIVEARGLSKQFSDQKVVGGINLEIYQGECFGILGPTSSGKSSLIRMMYGSSLIDQGELFVMGLNAKTSSREIKSRIGVAPQDDCLDTEFTVRENLMLFAGYHGVDHDVAFHRTEDLLKLVRIENSADQFVHTVSAGTRRRLSIARSMINHPQLLFLDEPTAGLGGKDRLWVWEFLKQLKQEMGTVIMTTHYTEEAERICNRIAMIDRGQILAVGEPHKLIEELIGTQVIEFPVASEDLPYYLTRLNSHNLKYQVIHGQINVHLPQAEDYKQVFSLIDGMKMTLRQPTLSDVFLKLAGHDLREEPL